MRAKLEQLRMEPGQDPDEFFLKATRYRAQLQRMNEPMTDRRIKDTIIRSISSEHDNRFCVYRNLSFDLDELQSIMRNFYCHEILHKDKTPTIGGRKVVMTAVRSSSL